MLLLPLVALTLPGSAQAEGARAPSAGRTLSELHHTSWTEQDGVPGEVLALAQTRDGYLWLGTANGLCRFDGAHFETFQPPSSERFPSHIIESLLATSDGGLFIGFRNAGAALLKDGRITIYGEAEGMPSGTVRGFARTRDGAVWAATSYGLLRLLGPHWQRIGKDWDYPWPRAQSLFVDRDGTLWVAGDDRILFLREGQNHFQSTAERVLGRRFEVNRITQAPDGEIWMAETSRSVRPIVVRQEQAAAPRPQIIVGSTTILFDDAGSLWISSLGDGVGRIRFPAQLSGQGTRLFGEAAEIFSQKDGLSSNYSSPLLEDREGNIWVGTSTGLDRFQETALVPSGLPPGSSDMVLIAGDHGDLWTASLNRQLNHIEGRSLTLQPQKESAWAVTSGYRDNDGSLWLGGTLGIRHLVKGRYSLVPLPQDIQNPWILALTKAVPDGLWAVIARSGIYRLSRGVWMHFGAEHGLPQDLPTNMFTDSAGRVWSGYLGGRLGLFEGDRFRMFTASDGIQVGDVLTIYEHGSHLWIGGEFGLQLLTGRDFRRVQAADDSKFRGISGIVETSDGDLWLNAANGILHIASADVQHALSDVSYRVNFHFFNYLDGLPGTSAKLRARPTAIQGSDGRLWFSVANGVVWIDPQNIQKNRLAPPVYVSMVRANDHEYESPATLNLPVGTTSLEIQYTALSFSVPERVRFRYKMAGADEEWQDAGSRREAFYTNLGPGHHPFTVIACNNDGVWNAEGAAVELVIPPRFTQTSLFKVLCLAILLLSLWLAFRLRMTQVARQLRARMYERAGEREQIARDLHDTFFQSIQGLVLRFNTAASRLEAGHPTRRMFDEALKQSDAVLAEGRELLVHLHAATSKGNDLPAALAQYGEQMQEGCSVDFKVAVTGSLRLLHPVVFEELSRIGKEALSNAFRHSMARSIEAELSYEPRELRMRIRDDGAGIDSRIVEEGRRDGHLGMVSMRARAKNIGAQLDLWSRTGGGTEVELRIPANVAYASGSTGKSGRLRRKGAAKADS